MIKLELHQIPATSPPMARIEEPDNPDAWISADAGALEEIEQ